MIFYLLVFAKSIHMLACYRQITGIAALTRLALFSIQQTALYVLAQRLGLGLGFIKD